MIKKLLTLSYIGLNLSLTAQVNQNIIVEHFTNSACSVCASNNPALFTNLANNPNILHIAVHPSVPYSSCELYKHNTSENNARTSFYGILNGTPRIVINGNVVPPTSFGSTTLFDNYKNKTTSFEIKVSQKRLSTDSLTTTIIIKATSAHSFTDFNLYVPIVEDSLNYASPNGEKLHHNVFRKVAYNQTISAPVLGDSLIINTNTAINNVWNLAQIKSIAMLQNSTNKNIEQVAESLKSLSNNNSNLVKFITNNTIILYPNPATNEINISSTFTGSYKIFDLTGKVCLMGENNHYSKIDIQNLQKGMYIIALQSINGQTNYKFNKE